jgi:cell division protein FtsQ
MFDLRSLNVSGNARLTSPMVGKLAGLDSSTNVLWLSVDAAEQALEANPWVASAEVTRTLPSSVAVVVRERVPAAVISTGSAREDTIIRDDSIAAAWFAR